MPMLSLAEAAKHCGVNRSTILRAVKSGKVSGTRNNDGSWSVEASELFRVFEPKADTSATPQPAQRDSATDALVSELRAVIADLRRDRDAWREQAERLALITSAPLRASGVASPQPEQARTAVPTIGPRPAEPSRFRRAWRWMRATGCLAGAGLLLALSTVPAGAQQQQPQQQPPPGCFTVEMSHSTQGNPQGSILLDRCTGKTWLLLCIRNDTAGCAFRWAPIPDATEPAGGP